MEAKAIRSMTAPAACVDCCDEQQLRQHRGRLSEGDEKQRGLHKDTAGNQSMRVPANEGTSDSRDKPSERFQGAVPDLMLEGKESYLFPQCKMESLTVYRG